MTCMPHSPYFGPGYWATLQLLAAAPGQPFLERLYVEPNAMPGWTPLCLKGEQSRSPHWLASGSSLTGRCSSVSARDVLRPAVRVHRHVDSAAPFRVNSLDQPGPKRASR